MDKQAKSELYLPNLWKEISRKAKQTCKNEAVGVIDSDFRNEMSAVFYKNSDSEVYKPGDRVCQLVIMPIPAIEFIEVDELSETERGANGFGSMGVR